MKTLYTAALLMACAALISACNTMGGLGEDIQEGGKALERAAD